MEYDLIVIGAGAAGEAAASVGAELGSRVAVVETDLVGGECTFWACMPSKSLLDSAGRRAGGQDYPWEKASCRRDWMISREEIDYPSDESHVKGLESAGAQLFRGTARVTGPGKVEITRKGEISRTIQGRNLIICTGSVPIVPDVNGLIETGYWTNREATSTRALPSSIVILGGGPMGVETAQYFVRFGVRTVLVDSNERILSKDHPRSSEEVMKQIVEEGVDVYVGIKALSVEKADGFRRLKLSNGTTVAGEQLVVAVGRKHSIGALGLEEAGINVADEGPVPHDEQMRLAPGVFIAGDAAGGLQFTHLADYQGRVAAKAALGKEVKADLSSVPRATYTDPETAAVGLSEEEAKQQGVDAFEVVEDFSRTARGSTIEGSHGHLTAVVDRQRGTLVGAFAACRGASEMIHEAVLAIKQGIPVEILADTIHAFPTAARVFGNLMAEAHKNLK